VKLCYKKCDLLTNGEFPHRTTAWSCCKEKRCNFHEQSKALNIETRGMWKPAIRMATMTRTRRVAAASQKEN